MRLRSNGYGRGKGILTIISKPLEQAIKDGDNIRAVVRETSINQNDKTPTITSPSAQAQEATIHDCYRRVGLDPTQTPYMEAHMTRNLHFLFQVDVTLSDASLGTMTGDPIEAKAIGNVFGQGKPAVSPVIVGSIKTTLGHLGAASGLAGVMKAVLAIEKGVIPPKLNFARPNPAIDLKACNVTSWRHFLRVSA
jgi:acyl transferase domain-containing protein